MLLPWKERGRAVTAFSRQRPGIPPSPPCPPNYVNLACYPENSKGRNEKEAVLERTNLSLEWLSEWE